MSSYLSSEGIAVLIPEGSNNPVNLETIEIFEPSRYGYFFRAIR